MALSCTEAPKFITGSTFRRKSPIFSNNPLFIWNLGFVIPKSSSTSPDPSSVARCSVDKKVDLPYPNRFFVGNPSPSSMGWMSSGTFHTGSTSGWVEYHKSWIILSAHTAGAGIDSYIA
jgi:hypothetical protein